MKLLALSFAFPMVVAGETIIVCPDGSHDFADIQSALDAATDGDRIEVLPGDYDISEPLNFNRRHDPANPFEHPVKNVIVGTAEGPEVTLIRANPPEGTLTMPAVVFRSGEDRASELRGFRIEGGIGRLFSEGGGIDCMNGSPVIRNCIVTRNLWTAVSARSPDAAPVLAECVLTRNAGTGFYSSGSSQPKLQYCTISHNSIGGLYSEHALTELYACHVYGNYGGYAGGCYFHATAGAPSAMVSCAVFGNRGDRGGGVWTQSVSMYIAHCTVACNKGAGGAGIYNSPDWRFPEIASTIVWNNFGPEQLWREYIDGKRVAYSTFQARNPPKGTGNSNLDPLFRDSGEYDFARFETVRICGADVEIPDFIMKMPNLGLRADSPAIDTGTEVWIWNTDVEGNPRTCHLAPDRGAFESCDVEPEISAIQFVRGDANADGAFNIADPISVLASVFLVGTPPPCRDAADSNDDGDVDIADGVDMLQRLFFVRSLSVSFVRCGPDPTDDGLDCAGYGPCR